MRTDTSFKLMVCVVLMVVWVLPALGDLQHGMTAPRDDYRGSARGDILYVGVGQTYSSIQDAVDAASYGDTVFVYNGTYEESIQLKPGIKLIGETPNRPVLDGMNIPEIKYGRVSINASSDVLIEGFIIKNGDYGITGHQCLNLTISRNIFRNLKWWGMRLWNWTETVVTNNIFVNMSWAIDVVVNPGNSSITATNNVFYNNQVGIWGQIGAQIIHNNIFVNNDQAVNRPNTEEGTSISNNLFWNNYQNYIGYSGIRSGDIIADPQFVGNMYRVSWDSPVVDAGNNEHVPAVDFDDLARPVDADFDGLTEVDIGAYEKVKTELTYYVDSYASADGDGSISKPFIKIQDAIDNATSGDTIFVFNGTYEEKIRLKDGMKLIGEMPNRPTIDGSNINSTNYRTMVTPNHDVLIEGFVIKQGEFSIRNTGYKNVTISRNILQDTNWTSIQCSNGAETFIINNIFFNVKESVQSNVGGIKLGWLPPYDIIANNVFDGCYGGIGGDGVEKIVNNIFVNCDWAIHFCDTPGENISNNLFWNNSNDFFRTDEGQNNITEDPQFIDSSYHISWNSPAVDTGTSIYVPAHDFDGEFRSFDGDSDGETEVDVGLDEKVKNTLYVDADASPGGNGTIFNPFNRIQDAIDTATSGYTIRVYSGKYQESITVNKTLTLIGAGYGNTIIAGSSGSLGSVITITEETDWCNISGFNINGSGMQNQYSGILLQSDNNIIQECKVIDNNYGIAILNSNYNTISNCIFESNIVDGIYLSDSSNNNIVRNNTILFNQDYGIRIDSDCNSNSIFYNNFIGNALSIDSPSAPQCIDDGVNNEWNTTDAGNFWFGAETDDVNQDDIADIPYSISGSSDAKDHKPLVNVTSKIEFEPPDVFPPDLVYTNIEDNATDFPIRDPRIEILFSEPMNASSVEAALLIEPAVNYTSQWNIDNTNLIIVFIENLSYSTTYDLTISTGATDQLGNQLEAPLDLEFTTEVEPKEGKDEPAPDQDFFDNSVLLGIIITCFLLTFIILTYAVITRNRRKRKEVLEREKGVAKNRREYKYKDEYFRGEIADEYHYPKDFQHDSDEFLMKLADEALVFKKPSDFNVTEERMFQKIAMKYRSGELSKATFEAIRDELIKREHRRSGKSQTPVF